jgi:peptidyl-tRNA hydrolase, PTH1 family
MLKRLRRDRPRIDQPTAGGDVFLIVGLGNPGRRYQATRHNAGFMVVDTLYDLLPPGTTRSRFQAELAETRDDDRRIVLVKPQTFMNESGIAISQVARWYRVPMSHTLVIYDDLDLPFGTIRLRADGSAGGHNGVASTIAHLKTSSFPRLRIGIGRPQSGPTVPYVLSVFSNEERTQLPAILESSAAALCWLRDGITNAMNEYNRRLSSTAQANVSTGQRVTTDDSR